MKTKAFLVVVIAALFISACTKTSEDKVTEAFKEYVKTDFGNPSDFIEITKFGEKDTISTDKMIESIIQLDSMKSIMTNEQIIKLELLRQKLEDDSTFIVQHHIKVRTKDGNDKKKVFDYYVIERNGEYSVQDHEINNEEVPDVFVDVFELLKEVLMTLNVLTGDY